MMKTKSISSLPTAAARIGCVTIAIVGLGYAASAMAQVNVNIPGVNVKVGDGGKNGGVAVSIGGKNSVGNTSGSIDEDADMEGVTIINDSLSIDGEKVPKGKTRHTGKKSGIKYVIKWSKNGNIAVSQE
jgi:hypothetical protein